MKPQVQALSPQKWGVAVHACNPSMVEAGEGVQSDPQLQIYESLSQQQQRGITDYDKLPGIRQDLFLELVDLEKVLVWRLESPWIQVPSRHFAVFHTLVCRAQHRVILMSE